MVLLWAVVPGRQTGPAAESEGEGQGHGRAAEGKRIAQLAQQPERARARPRSYLPLGPKRQRRWGWAPRPFCTPDARLTREGEGWSERRGGPGREGDARAFEYALRCRLARRGRQRRYGGAARREGAREGRWSLPGGACGRRDVVLGVMSSAGERGAARGSQTSRTGFVWAAEAISLAVAAGEMVRWAEASVERAALRP